MNKRCRKIIYTTLSVLNKIIPKEKKILVYAGDKLHDNSEAMFSYLVKHTDYRIVCVADKHMHYGELRKGVKFYRHSRKRTLYELLTCKVCVDSFLQALRLKPTNQQLFLQLWHGTPLKRIDGTVGERNGAYYSKINYASPLFRETIRYSFDARDEQMFLCGNPRNDYLFDPAQISFTSVEAKKQIIWMPTYRHGLGSEDSSCDIPVLTRDNVEELNELLNQYGFILYVKPHPLQSVGFSKIIGNRSNIQILTDDMLREKNIPLYRFLGSMDALLTDYSSVYFDYLLLDRPIGFVIGDMEEYGNKRGFTVENPLEYMPGQKISSMEELKLFFSDLAFSHDPFANERKTINQAVNYYQDASSCERCLQIIREKL